MQQEINNQQPIESPENVTNESENAINENENIANESEKFITEYQQLKDKYLRLMAEFDNFRRRTQRDNAEFAKTAAKDVIKDIIPILDDFERAFKNTTNNDNTGFELIFSKLKNTLENKGLKPMQSIGNPFDTDLHEAIAEVQAPAEMTGKIIDELEKGYYLYDKIIRHAKVIVGK